LSEPLEGNFEGVGIEFTLLADTLVVVNPVAGGPSDLVGIKADDRDCRSGWCTYFFTAIEQSESL